MRNIKLTWSKTDVLTDSMVWACKDNAIENILSRGEPVTNHALRAECELAADFLIALGPVNARVGRAYLVVAAALA
jgi:hypothetical protein